MTTYTAVTDDVTDNLAAYHTELIDGLQSLDTIQGFMQNAIISRTVASNNLTVALKTLVPADEDPSSTNPITVRIGNTKRQITSALSVSVNAGTDTFGLGAAGCLTDQDLFFVGGFRAASSTVFVGIARFPFGRTYADFSATATNEKYLAYSGSAPASTDEVEIIGRFNVTNSGSASYNWSVPGTSVIKSMPIFETRRVTYTPTRTNLTAGTSPTSSDYYQIIGRNIAVWNSYILGTGGDITGALDVSLPFSASSTLPAYFPIGIGIYRTAAGVRNTGIIEINGGSLLINATNTAGTYSTDASVAAAVPFDWTTSDRFVLRYDYPIG